VVDRFGRLHALDNVFFTDGSVFASSGGFNPTLTIMALALRSARSIAGATGARSAPPPAALPATGDDGRHLRTAASAAAAAAAAAARARGRASRDSQVAPSAD
jgi:hypothetical protein